MLEAFYVEIVPEEKNLDIGGISISVGGAVLKYGFKGVEASAAIDKYYWNATTRQYTPKPKLKKNGKPAKNQSKPRTRAARDFLGLVTGDWFMGENDLKRLFIAILSSR